MSYRGLVPHEMTNDPAVTVGLLQGYNIPELQSWRNIRNARGTFVWQVKPPGVWVILMRQDEQLVTSNSRIPLDVDYEAVYSMLVAHKGALLCRLDDKIGLIGIAASRAGARFLPMMPGFSGTSSKVILPEGVNPPEIFKEVMANINSSWPEGLQKPSILHIQAAHPLLQAEHRKYWLTRCPEGLWLLTSDPAGFQIYEVLS